MAGLMPSALRRPGRCRSKPANYPAGTVLLQRLPLVRIDISAAFDLSKGRPCFHPGHPNLTTVSGETAEFLAVAIPVVTYRHNAPALNINPVSSDLHACRVADGRISLRVRSEVSEFVARRNPLTGSRFRYDKPHG